MRCGTPERVCMWAVYVFFTMVWVIFVRIIVKDFEGNQTAPIMVGLVPPLVLGICAVSYRRNQDGIRRILNRNEANAASLSTISGTRIQDTTAPGRHGSSAVMVDAPPPKYEEVVAISDYQNAYFNNYPSTPAEEGLSQHVRWSITSTDGNGVDNGLRAHNGRPAAGIPDATVSGVEARGGDNNDGHRLDQMGSLAQNDAMVMGSVSCGPRGGVSAGIALSLEEGTLNCLPSYEEAVKKINAASVT